MGGTPEIMDKKISTLSNVYLDTRKTPWMTIYIAVGFLTMTGAQMSVYYMSTMPYLVMSYKKATVETFGYVVAAGSLGVMIGSPLFGFWQQKTNSTRQPVMCGFILAALGNLCYAFLSYYGDNVLMMVLLSRFLAGFATGTLGALRSFVAVSSTPSDRIKAAAISNGGFTLGLSVGPVIQIAFLPFGAEQKYLWFLPLNMYTTCAYFMAFLCVICLICLVTVFKENYVGIFSKEEKKSNPFLIIPKFDVKPVWVCFYLWFSLIMVSTTIEGISVPITIAMYAWNNSDSIFYNGFFMAANCFTSMLISIVFAKTSIANIDRRKLILFGQVLFSAVFVFLYPWDFYGSSLKAPRLVNGTENLDHFGGCSDVYTWCKVTTAIPKPIYVTAFIIGLGIAFPFVQAPMCALFSEILGPRKQGTMQGLLAFTGSVAQFSSPIIITSLFKASGYRIIMLYHFVMCSLGVVLIIIFYKHMIPLQLNGTLGRTSKYKNGLFTRF